MTPHRIAANSVIHTLWADRTSKGSVVPWALGGRPAEEQRPCVFTALRETRGGYCLGCTDWEFLLHTSQHILPQQQPPKWGMDLAARVAASSPSLHAGKIVITYWIQGCVRGGRAWIQTAHSIRKHFLKRFI